MVKLPKKPDEPEDFNDIASYLQSGVFAPKYNIATKRNNLRQRCKDLTQERLELREALLEKFHVGASHFEYHKTCTMLYENTLESHKNEVKAFVQKCPTCIQHVSIKEKNDVQSSAKICLVIPLKNKEGRTVNKKLIRHFSMSGPSTEIQSDNGSEFITDVLKKTCEALKVQFL
ncbi:9630_t:CDS:2 [Paraglomus brasilianum]|uniref:9630_t:CDS:1 n=1 Tax=Paraglomus brasilianum TaxID=144538 RepID=A0A9N9CW19_9GLOM|nr:9630_t:CDS:2 [Paraglomus brasilianum]